MTQIWIMCRSITHAQNAAKLMERSGITATVTRAPKGLSPKGCGYAVTVRRKIPEAIRVLEKSRLPHGKIFELLESGEYREVEA